MRPHPKRWFTVVEIEINTHCNRTCAYCPRTHIPFSSTPQYMPMPLYEKLIKDLEGIKFKGRLSYHFYNEPLLHPDLEYLVEYASKKLPGVFQELYTNGDFLSEERYHLLLKKGINNFLITSHSNEDFPERPHQTVQFPSDLLITNRGGSLFDVEKTLKIPCFVPSEMLIVSYSGDVLFCFEDIRRSGVMGNINSQPLEKIWFSERYRNARVLLREGNRQQAYSFCRHCNNKNYYAPDMTR